MLLAGTAFASIAVAASSPIRRVALGLIERTHYAAAITWLIVVSASII